MDTLPSTGFFSTANAGFTTTLGETISAGAVTVPLTGTAGLTESSIFVGIIEPGLTDQQVFTGTVDTVGVQITNVTWMEGTNTDHAAGVTIVDYVTDAHHNLATAGITKQHTQAGAHTGITTDTLATTGNTTVGGTLGVTGNTTLGGTVGVTGLLTPTGGLSTGSITASVLAANTYEGANATTLNPIPGGGSYSDIAASTVTFSVPTASYIIISFGGLLQVNSTDTAFVGLNVDGTVAETVSLSNQATTTAEANTSATYRIPLASGSHTIKLQAKCTTNTNCVVASPFWWGQVTSQ